MKRRVAFADYARPFLGQRLPTAEAKPGIRYNLLVVLESEGPKGALFQYLHWASDLTTHPVTHEPLFLQWLAVSWHFALPRRDRDASSYAAGRAVELVHHAFNEAALYEVGADAVRWSNITDQESLVIERAHFDRVSPVGQAAEWLRIVRR